MPYTRLNDLPKAIRDHVPKHGQEIWMKAYNSAYEEYEDPEKRRGDEDREETAAKVAWAAVKHLYEKGDDGDWHRK